MKLLIAAAMLLLPVPQKEFPSFDAPAPRSHQFIAYASDEQQVPADKRAFLELHFQVEGGYHVNSHTPKSDLLLPTRIDFEPVAGVKLAPAEYPAGALYSPAFDPTEKLDVYAGSFVVKAPVTAAAGTHELHGTLRYQACDRAVCYPPKTLPIVVLFTAR